MSITTKTNPIGLFFQAEQQPVHRIFHCPFCTKRLFDMTGRLVMMVDNSGPQDGFYIEIKCRNSDCQQIWRIFAPPPVIEPTFVVTVNGVPI